MPLNALPAPPVAERRAHRTEVHGVTLEDPYAWLRDPLYPKVEDPAILAYLAEENGYFAAAMASERPLVETLFAEMKGRIKEDDRSVPVTDGDWSYWWAFEAGAQYRRWYRRPRGGGPEQLIFDEPAEAAGKDYFRGSIAASPDGRHAVTRIDDSGSERFRLRVRDLATGAELETVTEVGGGLVWTADSRGIV